MSVDYLRSFLRSLHDTTFVCPACGHKYDGSECDTAQYVVSYWGGEDHDFSCDECGAEFIVRETVSRTFTAARSSAEIDDA